MAEEARNDPRSNGIIGSTGTAVKEGIVESLKGLNEVETEISNNSLPPLIVTMTSLGRLSPWSKRICISPMYIELWHELSGAIPFTLTLYHIYIYRH